MIQSGREEIIPLRMSPVYCLNARSPQEHNRDRHIAKAGTLPCEFVLDKCIVGFFIAASA
jgi:hypothetical protein